MAGGGLRTKMGLNWPPSGVSGSQQGLSPPSGPAPRSRAPKKTGGVPGMAEVDSAQNGAGIGSQGASRQSAGAPCPHQPRLEHARPTWKGGGCQIPRSRHGRALDTVPAHELQRGARPAGRTSSSFRRARLSERRCEVQALRRYTPPLSTHWLGGIPPLNRQSAGRSPPVRPSSPPLTVPITVRCHPLSVAHHHHTPHPHHAPMHGPQPTPPARPSRPPEPPPASFSSRLSTRGSCRTRRHTCHAAC